MFSHRQGQRFENRLDRRTVLLKGKVRLRNDLRREGVGVGGNMQESGPRGMAPIAQVTQSPEQQMIAQVVARVIGGDRRQT